MKILIPFSAFALIVLFACQSQSTLPNGHHIGREMEPRQAVRFSVVDASPKEYFDKTVLVEARIKTVCQTGGCWMLVEDAGRTARVRWETGCGGEYTFPKDGAGKRVLIQGTFYPKTTTAEEREHLEEEAGHQLTIPVEGYEFNASSVLVIDG